MERIYLGIYLILMYSKKKKNASNLNELIKELKKSWIEQKSQN